MSPLDPRPPCLAMTSSGTLQGPATLTAWVGSGGWGQPGHTAHPHPKRVCSRGLCAFLTQSVPVLGAHCHLPPAVNSPMPGAGVTLEWPNPSTRPFLVPSPSRSPCHSCPRGPHVLTGAPAVPPPLAVSLPWQPRCRARPSASSNWPGHCSWWPWTLTPSTTRPSWPRRPWPPSSSTSKSPPPRWVQVPGVGGGGPNPHLAALGGGRGEVAGSLWPPRLPPPGAAAAGEVPGQVPGEAPQRADGGL